MQVGKTARFRSRFFACFWEKLPLEYKGILFFDNYFLKKGRISLKIKGICPKKQRIPISFSYTTFYLHRLDFAVEYAIIV